MPETITFGLELRRRLYADAQQGLDSWAAALNAGMAVSGSKMPGVMRQHLLDSVAELARKHGNKWPSGTSTGSLSSRSGSLLASLQEGVRVAGSTLADVQGSLSGVEYLAVQEYGGTVTARGAQYLAIPLPAALRPDGTPIRNGPRDWDKTFVQMSRAGNLLVFRRAGAGIEPLYALKRSVTLPPRFGARQMARDRMPYFVSKVVDTLLSELRG